MIPIYSGDWMGGEVWAFSVRPDLLPLGWDVNSPALAWLSWWSWDPVKTSRASRVAVDMGYHLPGVVEAMVLAGQARQAPDDDPPGQGVRWVEAR